MCRDLSGDGPWEVNDLINSKLNSALCATCSSQAKGVVRHDAADRCPCNRPVPLPRYKLAVPDPARLSEDQILKKGKKKRKRREVTPPGPYPCPLGCLKHIHLKTPTGINNHIRKIHLRSPLTAAVPFTQCQRRRRGSEVAHHPHRPHKSRKSLHHHRP